MYARHVEHVSTRAARRLSAQYELRADESSSPQTAHLARENRHAVAQRPHTSERGEPAMNSPLSSAITDTCAGPPQTGQAAPLQSSATAAARAARSRTGPAAAWSQNPSRASTRARSSSHVSTHAASSDGAIRASVSAASPSGAVAAGRTAVITSGSSATISSTARDASSSGPYPRGARAGGRGSSNRGAWCRSTTRISRSGSWATAGALSRRWSARAMRAAYSPGPPRRLRLTSWSRRRLPARRGRAARGTSAGGGTPPRRCSPARTSSRPSCPGTSTPTRARG